MRRTRELVLRGDFEGETKGLARHDQSRTEDLWHLIVISEHENVADAEHQPDPRWQDLDPIAALAARPGSLRNLEQLLTRVEAHRPERSGGDHDQHDRARKPEQPPTRATHASARAGARRLLQQEFDVVRDVTGRLAERDEQAQLARAIDQVDEGGVMHLVTQLFVLAVLLLDRDTVRVPHGRQLLARARRTEKARIEQ